MMANRPTRRLSHKERQKLLAEHTLGVAMQKEHHASFDRALILFLFALHDQEGFGKTRSLRVLHKIIDVAKAIDDGYVNMNDIKNTVGEELDIWL